jgi:hypothetical protein
MGQVDIIGLTESILLRADQGELHILPNDIKELKNAESHKEFQQTLLRYVIPTKSTEERTLFQRWARNEHALLYRLREAIHKMELPKSSHLDPDGETDTPEQGGPVASPLESARAAFSARHVRLVDLEDESMLGVCAELGLAHAYPALDPSRLDLLRLETAGDDSGESKPDRLYRRQFLNTLNAIFDNRCANCGSRDKGHHLDHFMIPRSRGGTFLIKLRSGFEVHNALPLCEQCNTRKGDSDYRQFFTLDTLSRIFETLSRLAVDEGMDPAA